MNIRLRREKSPGNEEKEGGGEDGGETRASSDFSFWRADDAVPCACRRAVPELGRRREGRAPDKGKMISAGCAGTGKGRKRCEVDQAGNPL